MGTSYSHNVNRTHIHNGFKTNHHEIITRNYCGLVLTYTQEGDNGNKKIVVTKKGTNYRIVNTYDNRQDDNIYTKEKLLETLRESGMQDHLKFMIEYLEKRSD